jgi:hypothetical protein
MNCIFDTFWIEKTRISGLAHLLRAPSLRAIAPNHAA